MFSFEPPRTAYDLHFQIAGIPVRVHPLFWLATLILGSNSWSGDGNVDPDAGMKLLIWVGVMFVSILVHELGHSCRHALLWTVTADRPAHAGRTGDCGYGLPVQPCGSTDAATADSDQSRGSRCRLSCWPP